MAHDSHGQAGPLRGAPAGRRLRDRLVDRETSNPSLLQRHGLANQLLLVDDDLREAAGALGAVERFLSDAAALLEREDVTAAELARLAERGDAIDRLEELSETVTQLRRRLLAIASQL